MEKDFSTAWKSSSQPRKQKKYAFNAPYHIKRKFLTIHFSKDLAKLHGIKRLPARKGDKVKIVRGQFKGHIGKIEKVDMKHTRVYVTGAEMIKKDGTKIGIWLGIFYVI